MANTQMHLTSNPHFYVTILRDSQRGFLLGPYVGEAEALANVQRGRELALAADAFACFDAFGTASSTRTVRTVFGI